METLEKNSGSWFECVLNSLPAGIAIVERGSARLLFINSFGEEFAQLPPDNDPNYFWTDMEGKQVSRNDLPRFRAARGEKLKGYELTKHFPGGQITCVINSDVIPANAGQPERIVLVFQEIQERKRWEEGRKAEVKDLKEERSMREAFVAMLTHDLRTPLTVARMHTEMLMRKIGDEFHARCRNVIIHIDIVDKMIQDLLDANKLKAGETIPISPTEMCLNDIVQEALNDYRDLHGDHFFFHTEKRICGVWCPKAMRRMLDNLLSNAVKYGEQDGPVEVALEQDEICTKMSVHNIGPAIPEKARMRLFEPFKRAEATVEKAGWGIGLTLVKGLVEAHKGKVRLESGPATGTTFELTFPNFVGIH